jgi:signal transduction histidine kinase
MLGNVRAPFREAWRLVTHSLSGRLLLLTLAYVLISEVLIFLPSVASDYRELLDDHIQSAELAILPFTEPGGEELSAGLRAQLLKRAGAAVVLLKRSDQRQLFLVEEMPKWIDVTIDLNGTRPLFGIYDALDCLIRGGNRTLHVVAPTHIKGAQSIGIVLGEAPIREALISYSKGVLLSSLFLSVMTAGLVFTSLYFVLVRPMAQLTRAMVSFRANPEDQSRIIAPSGREDEIGIAERELAEMQQDIAGFLKQKTRLAALGSAVARIQHDLRNILANAQLASDRLTASNDPLVKRLAPRLVASLDRAVSLATNTLRYGRAEERPPERKPVALKPLIEDAAESAIQSLGEGRVRFANGIDPALTVAADPDQLYRMVLNLVRNAAEACNETGGEIRVSAVRQGQRVQVDVADDGPGIPPAMRGKLFEPFATAARSGGSGLGLAIARDLARGHGGDIVLVSTGKDGTQFRIDIPDAGSA